MSTMYTRTNPYKLTTSQRCACCGRSTIQQGLAALNCIIFSLLIGGIFTATVLGAWGFYD